MFANAHAHLRGDLDAAIQRAKDSEVEIILNAGIDPPSSLDAVEVAKAYDIVYACVGIHPWNADQFDQTSHKILRDLTREERVVAISEVGLDFVARMDPVTWTRGEPLPKELQHNAFLSQVKLAKDVELPIILHANAAHPEVLATLREEGASEVGGAIHGFNGNLTFAKEYLNLGFCLSVGRAITTPENITLQNVVKEVPIDRLLVETDGGEPADVKAVAEKVAELKGISLEEVGRITTSTLKSLLGM